MHQKKTIKPSELEDWILNDFDELFGFNSYLSNKEKETIENLQEEINNYIEIQINLARKKDSEASSSDYLFLEKLSDAFSVTQTLLPIDTDHLLKHCGYELSETGMMITVLGPILFRLGFYKNPFWVNHEFPISYRKESYHSERDKQYVFNISGKIDILLGYTGIHKTSDDASNWLLGIELKAPGNKIIETMKFRSMEDIKFVSRQYEKQLILYANVLGKTEKPVFGLLSNVKQNSLIIILTNRDSKIRYYKEIIRIPGLQGLYFILKYFREVYYKKTFL